MYADRFARPEGIKPGSLSIAIAINGALIGLLLFSAPEIVKIVKDPPLVIETIKIPPKPEPVPPKTDPQPTQRTVAPQPDPIVATPVNPEAIYFPPTPPLAPPGNIGIGRIEIVPPPPLPVFSDPTVDARFAGAFQPEYPAGERRAEHEGKVVIRVLIGIDGRVKHAERVSAESDQFWRVTEQRALTRWRFHPATRDGVPVEAWRTMTVRFELES